jgi:hypothetical protein
VASTYIVDSADDPLKEMRINMLGEGITRVQSSLNSLRFRENLKMFEV